MKQEILSLLSPQYPWGELLEYLPETDSTNDRLKVLARRGAPHGAALIAGSQSAGRGRKGRSFHSPAGTGIYLSILLRPDCAPRELMHLTCAAGVAMCDAVEQAAGFRPGIKWTNDLVFGRRKLGGILTELGFTAAGALDYAIVGIGLNCRQQPEDFPRDIQDIAGSLVMAAQRDVSPAATAAAMLEALWRMDSTLLSGKEALLERYRRDCITIGQQISLVRGDCVRHGQAVTVDDEGALTVLFEDGHLEKVNSGEVSVRGMYGYV